MTSLEKLLFPNILGNAYEQLPAAVQLFHDVSGNSEWKGLAEVKRGKGLLANLIAWFFRFPKAATEVPVKVTVDKSDPYNEVWTREFAGRQFISHLSLGQERDQYLVNERFGPITVSLALVITDDKLFFQPRKWRLFKLPMPNLLLPKGSSFETAIDGRYVFDVKLEAPFIGLIVAYRGWLEPVNAR